MRDPERNRQLKNADDCWIASAVLEIGQILLREPGTDSEFFLREPSREPELSDVSPDQMTDVHTARVGWTHIEVYQL